jgi:hypothetical protein
LAWPETYAAFARDAGFLGTRLLARFVLAEGGGHDALFGYFRQLGVGLLFLLKCQCQKIDQLFFTQRPSQGDIGAIGSDLADFASDVVIVDATSMRPADLPSLHAGVRL